MLFDKFYNRTIITGKIAALDPIHIGSSSNNSLNPVEIDDSVLKDSTGRPVIPGSSIKGVVRSFFESVLRANGIESCYVMDDEQCCTEMEPAKTRINEAKLSLSQLELGKVIYQNSCEVCKLFGGREFAGKLMFKDCYLIGEPIFEYRDGVGIDRATGAAKSGAKYDYEIVPQGSEFDFYLICENIDEIQEKYLNFIISGMESGNLSVGGMTTRGLGRFKLIDVQRQTLNTNDLKKALEI